MRGAFQYRNAAAAIAALRSLGERLPLSVNAIRAGLTRARLPGRFQVIPGEVTWILDVAHNGEAAVSLAGNLGAFHCPGRIRAVLAVLADKTPEDIARPLAPMVDDWFLTQTDDPRAMPADQLAGRLAPLLAGSGTSVLPDLDAALETALGASNAGDCVLVCGSFTTVGRALVWVGGDGSAGILRR
jgi:dihydrofolate synthase/folylpolyglutamate synthase